MLLKENAAKLKRFCSTAANKNERVFSKNFIFNQSVPLDT